MSSDGECNGGPIKMKRRRLHGACDLCRQKKIRCDSSKRPGNKCSNCVAFGSECTHVHVNQKIGLGYRSSRHVLASTSDSASVGELRKSMDPLLKTILSPTYQAPTNPAIIRETLVNLARYSRALEDAVVSNSSSPSTVVKLPPAPTSSASPPSHPTTATATASSSSRASPESSICSPRPVTVALSAGASTARWPAGRGTVPTLVESEGPVTCEELTALAQNFKRSIVLTSVDERFFGPSSNVSLLDTAIEMGERDPQMRPPPTKGAMQFMRPEFWTVHPWEKAPVCDEEPYEFPPPDLLNELVELFFTHINTYIPLLHRPTFVRGIESGLHLKDPRFGGTVLGVCATASRYSNDERVLLEGTDSLHSCGFKYHKQLRIFHESSLRAPNLYELQTLVGSSTPEKCWFLVGFGLRAALDIGLNRKANDNRPPTAEDELRKRVFWALVIAESVISSTVGRPPSITLVDFDCELPIDCDDEYWETEDPEKAFKQPPGIPSKISFFRSLIKLIEIHCAAQRSFYSVRHPEVQPDMTNEEWDRATLSSLDSTLNAWVDSVPTHLKWDPYHPNTVFLGQSAMLFTTFYYLQIFVHRPFISSPGQPALAFSSLAICTNAARACSRIMETQANKSYVPIPQIQLALFSSGLMLLLSIWRGRRSGFALMDEDKELKAVFGVINVLKTYENKWHLAGRFCDLLLALSSVGGLRLAPPSTTKATSKRSRHALEDEERHPNSLSTMESSSRRDSMDPTEYPMRPLPSAIANHHRRLSRGMGGPSAAGDETLTVMNPPLQDSGVASTSKTASFDPDSVMQTPEPPTGTFTFPFYSSELSRPYFQFNPEEDPSPPPSGPHDLETVLQQMDDSEFEALFATRTQPSTDFGASEIDATASGGIGQTQGTGYQYQQMQSAPGAQGRSLPSGFFGPITAPAGGVGPSGGPGANPFLTGGDNMLSQDNASRSTQQPGSNDLFLDLQVAAMWTGVPSGADWQDWSAYLPNVGSLNSMQRFSNGAGNLNAPGPVPEPFAGGPSNPFSAPPSSTHTPPSSMAGKSRAAALREQALAYLREQGDIVPSEAERLQLNRLRYGW
ncbi:hypothetical protein FA13DRAFT_1778290 [Coprinellus micaceus]|uniref:Zn(2)-C6 fungal-type domain-containing protein n=1 Tax=Coprinellus micaceus TaxID=71717 RepID=A0A4Y7SP97_COPMI|nr:hypothetical protein FA13DRAFT_1778290 [Coprinellus micaceus]